MFRPEVRAHPRSTGGTPAVAGILGGLVGATCCIGPAIGVAIGSGTGSFLLAMARYRPLMFLIGGALGFAVAAVWFKRTRRACPVSDAEARALRTRWVDTTLLAFALTYGIGRLVLTR